MSRVKVAQLSDIDDESLLPVEAEGTDIVLARIGDCVYALRNMCSHADAKLSDGDVYEDDMAIECPLHGSMFALETGDPDELPATEPVATFVVTIEGDDVFVDV